MKWKTPWTITSIVTSQVKVESITFDKLLKEVLHSSGVEIFPIILIEGANLVCGGDVDVDSHV